MAGESGISRGETDTRMRKFVVMCCMVCCVGTAALSQETPTPKKPAVSEETSLNIAPRIGKQKVPPIRIESEDLLDIQEDFIYAKARTKVWYGKFYLEADRIVFDRQLNEVQAYGNVFLKSAKDEIRGESARYNFEKQEGVAYNVYGRHDRFFFRSWAEEGEEPSFQRISESEALFRKASYTTCDFRIPHAYVRAKEIILYLDDRVFLRHATFYVWGVPVFYMPAYTRSLKEHSPWSFFVGHSSELGFYMRVGYDYWHRLEVPSLEDEEELVTKSSGHLGLRLDYFSKRGIGEGLVYKYKLDFGRHTGMLDLYHLSDKERNVVEGDSGSRWVARILHRTALTDDLTFLLNVDEFSDSEIYYDVYDRFEDIERGRLPERSARAALTYLKDLYVARIMIEVKERLSRDRISSFWEPGDDDLDFDIDPLNEENYDEDQEALSSKRFGTVTKRMPQLNFTTNKLRIYNLPLYYQADINVINNLDKGLNIIDTDDDAWVRGIDIYQSLTHIVRFSPRYTLLSKLGAGVAMFERDSWDYGYDFPSGVTFPYMLDATTFVDRDRFLVGSRRVSLEDVAPFYAYADFETRLNARFTDSLVGNIIYKIREGTDDSLGEFYESIGSRHTRSDLYNFRLKQHWIEANLMYFLRHPDLTLSANAGYNLQSNSDIYANELLRFAGLGGDYRNRAKTFGLGSRIDYQVRQIRDPSDLYAFEQGTVTYSLDTSYIPKSEQWWSKLAVRVYQVLDDDPLGRVRGLEEERRAEEDSFYEDENELTVSGTVGAKIGPKYILEPSARYSSKYNGLSRVQIILKRDLHDVDAQLLLGARKRHTHEFGETEAQTKWEYEIRFSLRLKTPYERTPLGAAPIKTLVDKRREAAIAEEL